MLSSIFFQICSLLYISLLICVYFHKDRLKTLENKIFSVLVISNFIGLLLDISSIFTIMNADTMPVLNYFITRLYLVYLFVWITVMTLYILTISNGTKKFDMTNFLIFYFTISILAIFSLPLKYYNQDGIVYSYGGASNFLYVISGLYIVTWIYYMVKNIKNIRKKKYYPMFVYLTLGGIVMAIQGANPGLLLMTSMETFITFLMYFTIENPDILMLRNLYESKSQAEKSNNDKALFLFDMSQRLKDPIKDIEIRSENIQNTDDMEIIKDEARQINNSSKNLSTTINGLLGISASESHNIEIRSAKYNLDLLLRSVVTNAKTPINNKKLEFRINIDDTLPKFLIGDSIRVKQIITIILNNAIKYTDNGYIDFNVSSIMKYDGCRLIVTIEDSGCGIDSEKLYKLLDDSKELDQTGNNKIVDTEDNLKLAKVLSNLIGGTILASSEVGKGSKFTIILDQRIADIDINNNSDDIVEKYEESYVNDFNIVVVEENEKMRRSLSKGLSRYNVNVEYLKYGVELLKKVRKNEKINLILISEELPKMTVYEVMKKIDDIENFNIPVVVMTSKKSDLGEHYSSYGFSDSISRPISRNDIPKLVDKYINIK